MKIKKFVGPSMSDCLVQVKKELGENAVILDSRKLPRGGPFSFLLNDLVEVTASTADQNLPSRKPRRDWGQLAQSAKPQDLREGYPGGSGSFKETPSETGGNGVSPEELELLSDEIRGLKDTVMQMADHLKYKQLPSLPKQLEVLHRDLLDNGVESSIANTITQEMTLQLSGSEFEDGRLLLRAVRQRVSGIVKAAPIAPVSAKPRVIALVGPTGVGKTTTLAKMATHPDIFGRKKVALISADTYRIAAVEQLKTFASIAGVPMEAVYRPADIRRAIDRFSDREVILIDTAGRSQNNRGQLKDLVAFMDYAKPDEVHLVLSISTRLDDQLDVIGKFQPLGPRRLLFTKLDETTNFGMILNVCFIADHPVSVGVSLSDLAVQERSKNHLRGKPISLLTCGQNVPDDIVAPNQLQLVRLVCERAFFREFLLPEVTSKLAPV